MRLSLREAETGDAVDPRSRRVAECQPDPRREFVRFQTVPPVRSLQCHGGGICRAQQSEGNAQRSGAFDQAVLGAFYNTGKASRRRLQGMARAVLESGLLQTSRELEKAALRAAEVGSEHRRKQTAVERLGRESDRHAPER